MTETVFSRPKAMEIVFSGKLCIERAAVLKNTVAAALDETDTLVIRLQQPEAFDFSFIQILCSLQRTAAQAGKKTFLLGDVPQALSVMLHQAGFQPEENGGAKRGELCLWPLAA